MASFRSELFGHSGREVRVEPFVDHFLAGGRDKIIVLIGHTERQGITPTVFSTSQTSEFR